MAKKFTRNEDLTIFNIRGGVICEIMFNFAHKTETESRRYMMQR